MVQDLLARNQAEASSLAIGHLHLALETGEDDAARLNDLSAAYFARAHQRGDPIDLVRALGAIERAHRLAPEDQTIAFNRALVRDRLHLLDAATAAWDAYLALDAASEWAREARVRRDSLRPPDATEGPQELREALQEELLGEWAEAAARDPEAARSLYQEASSRAAELLEATDDPLLPAAVARIGRAYDKADRRQLRRLIRGHRFYTQASSLAGAGRCGEAERLLDAATRELRAAGSPFRHWSKLLSLRCAVDRLEYTAAVAGAQYVIEEVGVEAPSALRGRLWWLLGTARFGQGELLQAGAAFDRAGGEFRRLGEDRNRVAVLAMKADLVDWTGQVDEAWRLRHASLAALRSLDDQQRRRLIALGAAYSALELGEPEAALVFAGEAIAVAQRSSDPLALANACLKRAGLLVRMGHARAAQSDLARAERYVERIVDDEDRRVTLGQLRLEQGRTLRDGSPDAARRLLEEALALWAGGDADLLRPEVEVELARCERAVGETDAAERRLRDALAELDRQRRTVAGDLERIQLADRSDAVHDELVALLLDAGRPREALRTADAAKARRLRERTGLRHAAEVPVVPDGAALDAGTAIVAYSLLADRLAIWVLHDGGVDLMEVPGDPGGLGRTILDVRAAVRERRDDAPELLSRLHDRLLRPVEGLLEGKRRLFIAPDDELFSVPFAALRDRRTGRFAVEDYSIGLVPAAAFGDDRPPLERELLRTVLAVADPAFDRGLHPRLPPLPGARAEVAEVVSHYAGERRILSGEDATASHLLAEVGGYDVVHVAAHGLVHDRDPFLSSLVLAAEPGRPGGEVSVGELAASDLAGSRVMVLAACDSSGGVVSSSEGPLGLAWPFLAQGVPAVVATLWPVNDDTSVRLYSQLHRALSSGAEVEEAVASAQRDAVARGRPIAEWAGVVAFRNGT